MLRSIQVVKDTFVQYPITNKELEIAMFAHLQRLNDDLELEGLEEGVDLLRSTESVNQALTESETQDEEAVILEEADNENEDDDVEEIDEEFEDEDEEEDEDEDEDDEEGDDEFEDDSEEDEK